MERGLHQTVQGGLSEQHAVETPPPWSTNFLGAPFYAFGDAWISKIKACKAWAEWYSLTKEFEQSWHVMLNLKPPESSCVSCDAPAEREKRPRDDSDPWTVAWCPDKHRRLEILGDNKVVINWMDGAWEVKGEEHTVLVVVWLINLCCGTWVELSGRELVRLVGVGTFFREHDKAASTHANWLMDNGDSGPGAQWEASDLHENLQKTRQSHPDVFRWSQKGERIGCGCLDIGCAAKQDLSNRFLMVDVC